MSSTTRGPREQDLPPRRFSSAPNGVDATRPAGPIVFIVDDDSLVRKAIERLLSSVELRCVGCNSADEFLRQADPDTAGCVILDLRLPGPSGLDLQQMMHAKGIAMPVLFLTGYGDVPVTARAMKAGALDVLTKPIEDQILLDAVHAALERDRSEREQREEGRRISALYATLTPREREVMALVVTGILNKQAATELGTSEKTVKVHRSQVMRKMHAGSLAELVRLADRLSAETSR